jgi:tRNA G46 methylase TrmB
MEHNFIPRSSSIITYGTHSLRIAKKVTKANSDDLNQILTNYHKKLNNQPQWTNKKTSSYDHKQLTKFTDYYNDNEPPVYIDIGAANGDNLAIIAKLTNAKRAICCDIEDLRKNKNSEFILIKLNANIELEDNSVHIVSIHYII